MAEGSNTVPTLNIDHGDLDSGLDAEASRDQTSLVPDFLWTPTSQKLSVDQSRLSSSVDDSASIAKLKVELVKLVTYNIDAQAHEKDSIKERRSSLISRISLAEALEQKKREDSRRVRIGIDVAVPPPDPPEIIKRQSYRYHSRRGGYLEQASKKRKRLEDKEEREFDMNNGFRSTRWKVKERKLLQARREEEIAQAQNARQARPAEEAWPAKQADGSGIFDGEASDSEIDVEESFE